MAGGNQNAVANRPQGQQAKQQPTKLTLAESEERLEKAIVEFGSAKGRLGRVVAIASAMRTARDMVASHWQDFATLRNTKLGWFTDKEYSDEVLQTALTQALLKGALPVNNEIGVISGGMYLQKTYFERQFRERPEISDVRITLDVPEYSNGRALVGGEISWRIDGKEDRIVCRKSQTGDQRIPVRVNAGQSDDQVLGKATRKILARALGRIDGSQPWEELAGDETGGATVQGTAETVTKPEASAAETPKTEPQNPPAKPTREQLQVMWRQFKADLFAAASNEQVDALIEAWKGGTVFPEKGQAEFAKCVLAKRKELEWTPAEQGDGAPAAEQAAPTEQLAAPVELPEGDWNAFVQGMIASDDPKVFGKVYDAHFGKDAMFRWTPEQEAKAGAFYQERVSECRPK
jgi:hypothetical protein